MKIFNDYRTKATFSHQVLLYLVNRILERCNPWPHVGNRHISISQLLSLWRHCHYDVSRLRRSRRSQPLFSLWRHSRCDVIRYWAGHASLTAFPIIASESWSRFQRHTIQQFALSWSVHRAIAVGEYPSDGTASDFSDHCRARLYLS